MLGLELKLGFAWGRTDDRILISPRRTDNSTYRSCVHGQPYILATIFKTLMLNLSKTITLALKLTIRGTRHVNGRCRVYRHFQTLACSVVNIAVLVSLPIQSAIPLDLRVLVLFICSIEVGIGDTFSVIFLALFDTNTFGSS